MFHREIETESYSEMCEKFYKCLMEVTLCILEIIFGKIDQIPGNFPPKVWIPP